MTTQPYEQNNSDAENALLGSILIDPSAFGHVLWIQSHWLYRGWHRVVWDIILDLVSQAKIPDYLLIADKLETLDDGKYAQYVPDLLVLANYVPTSDNIIEYANIVYEQAQKRALTHIAQEMVQRIGSGMDAGAIAQLSMNKLMRMTTARPQEKPFRTYTEVIDDMISLTLDRMDNPDHAILSGFHHIDHILGGFMPGELIYVAARPSMGKSAFGLSLARRIAGRFHHSNLGSVAVVTMEMSAEQQVNRITSARAGLNSQMARRGFRVDNEIDSIAWDRYYQTAEKEKQDVGDSMLLFDKGCTIDTMGMLLLQAQQTRNLRFVVIDYLDLFENKGANETERIGKMSMQLKNLARSLNISIVCLVQVNRAVEGRADRRPTLADLRQSGRLEQDADMVLGLYRPAFHQRRDDPLYMAWTELLVLKHREGSRDMLIPLAMQESAAQITDWDAEKAPINEMIALVHRYEGGH